MVNFYQVLDLPWNASPTEIKQAHGHLRKEWISIDRSHPNSHVAARKLEEIAEAYGVLSDKKARQVYDKGLRERRPHGRYRMPENTSRINYGFPHSKRFFKHIRVGGRHRGHTKRSLAQRIFGSFSKPKRKIHHKRRGLQNGLSLISGQSQGSMQIKAFRDQSSSVSNGKRYSPLESFAKPKSRTHDKRHGLSNLISHIRGKSHSDRTSSVSNGRHDSILESSAKLKLKPHKRHFRGKSHSDRSSSVSNGKHDLALESFAKPKRKTHKRHGLSNLFSHIRGKSHSDRTSSTDNGVRRRRHHRRHPDPNIDHGVPRLRHHHYHRAPNVDNSHRNLPSINRGDRVPRRHHRSLDVDNHHGTTFYRRRSSFVVETQPGGVVDRNDTELTVSANHMNGKNVVRRVQRNNDNVVDEIRENGELKSRKINGVPAV